MLSNLVCSLILHGRVTTTLAKARAARSVAEKMVTLGKKGSLHDRRLASARLHQEDAVYVLFTDIAPQHKERHGGYTRIIKKHQRQGDAAQLAILEWVSEAVTAKPRKKKPGKAAEGKPATEAPEADADDAVKAKATPAEAETTIEAPEGDAAASSEEAQDDDKPKA